jgi:hypothetical protein
MPVNIHRVGKMTPIVEEVMSHIELAYELLWTESADDEASVCYGNVHIAFRLRVFLTRWDAVYLESREQGVSDGMHSSPRATCTRRFVVVCNDAGQTSAPRKRLPVRIATAPVVPEPMKQSITILPGADATSTMRSSRASGFWVG